MGSIKVYFITILLLLTLFPKLAICYAAELRTGESVFISKREKALKDLYIFGSSITVDGNVTNDLVAGGSQLTLNGDVQGNINAVGADVVVRSNSKYSQRLIGANVTSSGKSGGDLIVIGSNIKLTKDASVAGDLVAIGSDILIESSVGGRVFIKADKAVINSQIKGDVQGEMVNLTLGKNAVINGKLTYRAADQAKKEPGSSIKGTHHYLPLSRNEQKGKPLTGGMFTPGAIYKLIIDIIVTLVFLLTFTRLALDITGSVKKSYLGNAATGFSFFFLWPAFSIFLLFLVWLGVASFLFYGLILIVTSYLTRIYIGWEAVSWWQKGKSKEIKNDWKIAVAGCVIYYILSHIPIAGFLILLGIYLTVAGALIKYIKSIAASQKILSNTSPTTSKSKNQ